MSATYVDIGVALVGEFGRERVRAEERRADRDIALFGEAARGAERFALGVEVEPIAGFDFDCADALGDKSVQSLERRSDELVFARGAGRPDGGKNAAAFAGDLFIGCAGEPELEFVRPVAAVDEVGVAIDQSGRNPAAFAIDYARAVRTPRRSSSCGPTKAMRPSRAAMAPDSRIPRPGRLRRERRKTGVEPNRVETIGGVCLNHGAQRLPAADHFMLRPNCPKGKGPRLRGGARQAEALCPSFTPQER